MKTYLDKVINFIAKKFAKTTESTELAIALAHMFLLWSYV